MSYCKQEGKDKIIFLTQEDHEKPSDVLVSDDNLFDEAQGAILPNGQINWECPCLGGMATGPCGSEFREAFSCFHYSTATEKGSDCLNEFREFSECIAKYPEVYKPNDDDDDDDDEEEKEIERQREERANNYQNSSQKDSPNDSSVSANLSNQVDSDKK